VGSGSARAPTSSWSSSPSRCSSSSSRWARPRSVAGGVRDARDRLLPGPLAKTHPRYGTPSRITIIIGVLVAILAGVTPIATAAELVNIGTLFAFMLVSAAVLLLRSREPGRPRPFRTPGVPFVPILAIVLSAVLIITLEPVTWLRFVVWMLIGFVVYFLYSRKASVVGQRRQAEGAPEA